MVRSVRLVALAALGLAGLAVSQPALAWRYYRGPEVFFAPPLYVAPPVYAPPPVYYAPRRYPSAQTCYAGAYICPLDQPVPVGGTCSCPTNNGRAFGSAQ